MLGSGFLMKLMRPVLRWGSILFCSSLTRELQAQIDPNCDKRGLRTLLEHKTRGSGARETAGSEG
eukprot:NODE_12789_length_375_cov_4.763804_g11637_i0.p2 GENE.NODE_12789_length_375_cov_4.763804_g11637_i0~~NODE_12789_length_375_cov_4.763804_g11637_i0.p2  ORF type:complete len:76 (-),score=0.45 NODE_12789_length_375_cov_4.763804_g11637_i0:147-341(-)